MSSFNKIRSGVTHVGNKPYVECLILFWKLNLDSKTEHFLASLINSNDEDNLRIAYEILVVKNREEKEKIYGKEEE